jgi:hypothetical protein
MRNRSRCLPYRWILPVAQLLVCAIVLWPIRPTNPPRPYRQHPIMTVWQRLDIIVELNLPVKLMELPCFIIDRAGNVCVPKGLTIEAWEAIMFPLFGLILWMLLGRSVETLLSARHGEIRPHIGWTETVVGVLILALGLLILLFSIVKGGVGMNIAMILFRLSSAVWAVLGSLMIVARIAQRRIGLRQRASKNVEASPS